MGRTKTRNTTKKHSDISNHSPEKFSMPCNAAIESIAPSSGPVYLEGRLVLSLSFQGMPPRLDLVENDNMVLENFRLWDDLTNNWHEEGLAVLRFEHGDVVMRLEPRPTAIWSGELDTRARVIIMPDLDAAGFQANQQYDLCWKRV